MDKKSKILIVILLISLLLSILLTYKRTIVNKNFEVIDAVGDIEGKVVNEVITQ